MKNTTDLIKEVSLKVAKRSEKQYLLNDVNNIIDEYGEDYRFRVPMIKQLEKAFTNANYDGCHLAGEMSFWLNDYLNGYDISQFLNEYIVSQ